MSLLGDTLLLTTLAPFSQGLPTVLQLAPLDSFAATCGESDLAGLLAALVGLLTGWEHPTQRQGIVIGRPTLAPTYQVLFARA